MPRFDIVVNHIDSVAAGTSRSPGLAWDNFSDPMGYSYFRGLAQGLIDDAIALSQANKRTQLIFRCVGLQVEVKTDALKSNWRILGDTQSAAKIEIAFGSNHAASNSDAYCRRDGVERHTGAGNKRLKQHIARARA
jgi:hypothetical protein